MRKLSFGLCGLFALSLVSYAPKADACGGDKSEMTAQAPAQKKGVQMMSVTELADKMAKKAPMTVLDVNGAETRAKMGVIPGAVLLTSSSKYDVKELPAQKDASLVFYCANQRCSASKKAAKVALERGYTDVSVLPEGIAGWKSAGQKTDMPRS